MTDQQSLQKIAQQHTQYSPAAPQPSIPTPPPDGLAQERKLLRSPRTRKYLRAIKKADTPSQLDEEIMTAVKQLPLNNKLLAILSPCGIPNCIIHAIDRYGNILQHFKSEEEMDRNLCEGYRLCGQYPNYQTIEVYTHTFCITYEDGAVELVPREGQE